MADPAINPLSAGLRRRCPRCGDGPLFRGFLTFADECEACGLDYRGQDVGDGPVAFIVLIVGFAVVIPALVVEVAWGWPVWLHMLVWLPLVVILCLALMPPFKGVMFALQYRHRAEEARQSDR
jgi:uncharacterized protein (DUF983 family)